MEKAEHADREPVLLGEALGTVLDGIRFAARTSISVAGPTAGPSSACDRCGSAAEWHLTVRGRWIMIEPGAWPTGSIPAGRRWRIAGDGTAVNLRSAEPSDTCRITHFDICPANPAPVESPVLLSLWRRNARPGRAERAETAAREVS
jgi:hypothetical protein